MCSVSLSAFHWRACAGTACLVAVGRQGGLVEIIDAQSGSIRSSSVASSSGRIDQTVKITVLAFLPQSGSDTARYGLIGGSEVLQ